MFERVNHIPFRSQISTFHHQTFTKLTNPKSPTQTYKPTLISLAESNPNLPPAAPPSSRASKIVAISASRGPPTKPSAGQSRGALSWPARAGRPAASVDCARSACAITMGRRGRPEDLIARASPLNWTGDCAEMAR